MTSTPSAPPPGGALRISIDVERLIHEQWKHMPLRRRASLFLRHGPRARRQIEALAIRKFLGEP